MASKAIVSKENNQEKTKKGEKESCRKFKIKTKIMWLSEIDSLLFLAV